MTQAIKRRSTQHQPQRAGANVLSLVLVIVFLLGGFWYAFPALTSGDWLWFSSSFDARPVQLAVVDRGRRTEIGPDDPRFGPLVDAFNQSIRRGYRWGAFGFSPETWQVVDRNGLLVETTYPQPIKLHIRGGFTPTTRLRLLVSGKDIHTTQVLFRSNANDWDPIPIVVNDVTPLQTTLAQQGFGTAQ